MIFPLFKSHSDNVFYGLVAASIYFHCINHIPARDDSYHLIDFTCRTAEGVPFPALLEALLMEITFEVIREAGVRMPRAIGPAISIVGALVIGQAAVEAGLVSGAMVIVVSFTAISNFVIPYFSMATAVRLMRFPFMLLAGTLGLFGILVGAVPLLVHLISLKSLGADYMMPFSPFYKSNLKDLILRVPWWAMKTRPNEKAGPNKTRQSAQQYPSGSNSAIERIQEPEPDR